MFTYFDYQRVVFKASGLDSKEKLAALAIASHFNWADMNPAFPSNALLVKETGLSERSVIRAKQGLVTKGYLTEQRRFNGSSLLTPTVPATATQSVDCHTVTPQDEPKSSVETEVLPQGQEGVSHSHPRVSQWQPNRELNNELNKEERDDDKDEEQTDPSLVKNVEEAGELKELEETVNLPLVKNKKEWPECLEDGEEVEDLEEQKTEDAVDHEENNPVYVPGYVRKAMGTIPQKAMDLWD